MKKWILTLCLVLGLVSLSACMEKDYGPVTTETREMLAEQAADVFESYFLTTAENDTIDAAYQEFVDDDNEMMANAMQAWLQLQDELGEYQGIKSYDVSTVEDGYCVLMTAAYEKRDLDVTLISDKKLSAWTRIALEAEYSFGEKMQKALMNTLLGMGTVFVVLIIIICVISLFGVINKIQAGSEKKKAAAPAPAPVAAPSVPAPEAPAAAQEDDLALIAVITAAIAAMENTSPDGLVVRSIRRAGKSNWKHS